MLLVSSCFLVVLAAVNVLNTYGDCSRRSLCFVETRGVFTMAQSRVALFLSVDIIMTMLTLAFVALRVSYRWQKRRLNISDYLICAAMV